jgi:hypothetical protein
MDIPAQATSHPPIGWPANELEEVLAASLGSPEGSAAGARVLEVLARSALWVPLPNGGAPHQPVLDLPTLQLAGGVYVPVFSSEQQFRYVVGDHMGYTVAPAVEFARGLPPQLGIAVNPDGAVGIPLPPPAVAELCRAGRTPLDGPGGARVRLFEPDWQDDPVDFLAAAAEEFAAIGAATAGLGYPLDPDAPDPDPFAPHAPAAAPGPVCAARRCLASVEGDDPVLYVGVELTGQWASENDAREAPLAALGRALGRVPVRWPVNLVLLDVTRDPVAEWLREKVTPFYRQAS